MDSVIEQVFETRRGNTCIIINNFKFGKKFSLKNGTIKFECTSNSCPCIVYTDSHYKFIDHFKNEHNHAAFSQEEIRLEVLRSVAKRKATDDLSARPGCKIKCCRFHLGQSWWRHIQKDRFLRDEYSKINVEPTETGSWLRKFFGLSALPPDEVPDAFSHLIEEAPIDDLR